MIPQWLWICLRDLWTRGFFADNCQEFIGQSAFKLDKLKAVKVPVPPLPEQRRIVARIEALTVRAEHAKSLLAEAQSELASFTPALLAKAFRGEL
jgi:type I restriction enzyme S subunit